MAKITLPLLSLKLSHLNRLSLDLLGGPQTPAWVSGWMSGKSADQDRHHAGMMALAKQYGPKGFATSQMIASETRTPKQFADSGLKAAIEEGLS